MIFNIEKVSSNKSFLLFSIHFLSIGVSPMGWSRFLFERFNSGVAVLKMNFFFFRSNTQLERTKTSAEKPEGNAVRQESKITRMKTIETERKEEEAIVLSNLITVRNFTSPFVQQFVSYSHKFQSKTIGLVISRWLGLRTPCSLYYCCPSNMPRERKSEQRLVTILFRSGLSNLITIPD